MEDRLHQPYRLNLIPGWEAVVKGARRAGAHGVALSGAGPSILALAPAAKAARVGQAMARAFARAGQKAKSLVLPIDFGGAKILGKEYA